MLAIDLDEDDDWVLVDHPRDWDVPSGDYLLLGCFLVWSLAQTIENTVNSLKAEGQEWLRLFDLDETAEQIVERLSRFLQTDHSDQNGTESV